MHSLSLAFAVTEGLRTIAFPSISTGAYRFPIDQAAGIASSTIAQHCKNHPDAHDEVRMVLFSAGDLEIYANALASLNTSA